MAGLGVGGRWGGRGRYGGNEYKMQILARTDSHVDLTDETWINYWG